MRVEASRHMKATIVIAFVSESLRLILAFGAAPARES